jgi:ABC-type phosphate transport system auxiliary subunit
LRVNICLAEELQQLKGQLDHTCQEKQAYILISNDIQGILTQAMSTISQPSNDPNKLPFVAQKLSEVNNLVASLQKHL